MSILSIECNNFAKKRIFFYGERYLTGREIKILSCMISKHFIFIQANPLSSTGSPFMGKRKSETESVMSGHVCVNTSRERGHDYARNRIIL
jgi:hypothetical protein